MLPREVWMRQAEIELVVGGVDWVAAVVVGWDGSVRGQDRRRVACKGVGVGVGGGLGCDQQAFFLVDLPLHFDLSKMTDR